MQLKNAYSTESVYATIVTDVNGKIIFMNRPAATKLRTLKAGDDVSEILDIDYIMKITMLDNFMDITVPKTKEFDRAVLRVCGKGSLKTLEIYLINDGEIDENLMLNDKRLFATYSETVNNKMNKSIRLKDFLADIVKCVKSDIRFAYRKFEIENTSENPHLYVNFAHLSTIVVAMIAIINEIEYRNTIKLSVENIFGEYVMRISVGVDSLEEANGIVELSEIYSAIGMRLTYIASLCENDDIEYDIRLKGKTVTASFIISNTLNTTGIFSFDPFGMAEEALVAYAIGLFVYSRFIETEEAGQGEE